MLYAMWSRIQATVGGIVEKFIPQSPPPAKKSPKYLYERPLFLNLGPKELQESKDTTNRPVVTTKETKHLPRQAGYAEITNGGKSANNEDQAAAELFTLGGKNSKKDEGRAEGDGNVAMADMASGGGNIIPVAYYGIFDGHAGYDAALMAAKTLQKHIQEKLENVLEVINAKLDPVVDAQINGLGKTEHITVDDLVTGVLEESFIEMDKQIERERSTYSIHGGCAVAVTLFMFGKVYVANSGDCRVILCNEDRVLPLSRDMTPYNDRERLIALGSACPSLLHGEFTCNEYCKRIHKSDLGKNILYRGPCMTGWSYKLADPDDFKYPLITKTGKKSRLMETIGVARGFGDYDLRVFDSDIYLKPFLSPVPEVKVFDTHMAELQDNAVIIMASDGLWDVITNSEAASIAKEVMNKFNTNDYKRYTAAAEELATRARGRLTNQGWRKKDEETGSFDDITVFVIPLKD